jgi:hypothetical protein
MTPVLVLVRKLGTDQEGNGLGLPKVLGLSLHLEQNKY